MDGASWRSGVRTAFAIGLLGGSTIACAAMDPKFRTFAFVEETGGIPVACGAYLAPSPVHGILQGDPSDPQESVWLLDGNDGRRLSIVWPKGFSVRFEPAATLINERGEIVAKAGDVIDLPHVSSSSHDGSYEDPYLAAGSAFGGCYPVLPPD